MHNGLSSPFSDEGTNLRAKLIGIYILLIAANVAACLWALTPFHNYPILLGTATLAYTFGLRHAFDAERPLDDQWRNEPPFLQTLGEKTQAGAVLGQNLHVVGARGARARARIFGFIAMDVGRLSSRAPHRCPAN